MTNLRPTADALAEVRAYGSDATAAAFLLGGIGTGNVSIGARGELRDWELFNRPAKGNELPYSFFAIRAQAHGEAAVAKVLEARIVGPHARSHGYYPGTVAGLPRFARSEMRAAYPFVQVALQDDDVPVGVVLEAFTPFIPLDADDSGIPCAVLRYTVSNRRDCPVDVSVVGSLPNAAGFHGHGEFFELETAGQAVNELVGEDGLTGIRFSVAGLPEDDLRYGSMALATRDPSVSAKVRWADGYWWDGIQEFWRDFSSDGRLEPAPPGPASHGLLAEQARPLAVGSLAIDHRLDAGESRTFEFLLAWHVPNRPRRWGGQIIRDEPDRGETVRNHYATRFPDAWGVVRYLASNLDRLESLSRAFQGALFGSTLPRVVIDAVAANITVLRSTTCFRLEDGTFAGWEGSFDDRGSCEGTCTHVWNYAQTVAFLFPELERSARRIEFLKETGDNGRMAFRTNTVFGGAPWNRIAAADGQLGTVIRLLREWRLSGDDEFLRSLWPAARKALEFARTWDTDGDLVLDGAKHNTYDIEFHGPDPLSNTMWLAALAAGEVMAAHLGLMDEAASLRATRESAARRVDALLFNGEYYVQAIDDVDAEPYQFGTGCLSDQVLGQLLASLAGLGHMLPRDHVHSAVAAIFEHNFRRSFTEHANVQRTYALNDEQGLVLCTWPRGGRPRLPFVYSDEVWTGVEYQVAAHLIIEGEIDAGLALVAAVRDRHDGIRRNPWNEVECGNHYARSMASWAVFQALCGYVVDVPNGRMAAEPRIRQGDFSAFVITGTGWGTYTEHVDPVSGELVRGLDPIFGSLDLELVATSAITGDDPGQAAPRALTG